MIVTNYEIKIIKSIKVTSTIYKTNRRHPELLPQGPQQLVVANFEW